MAADFDQQSYWHKRFASEAKFEWLLPSEHFVRLIESQLASAAGLRDGDASQVRILHIGSGTSDLQNHLRARGFTSILNVDFEPLAVSRGRDLESRAFGDVRTAYEVRDVTRLGQRGQPADRFHLVVDKSTVDAVACGGEAPLRDMAAGIKASLEPSAAWVSLSYSACRFELDDFPFAVTVLDKIPMPKTRQTDPDVFLWLYLLQPV